MAQCKGFLCGSNLIEGSVSFDKLDKEDFIENLREILKEESKEDWFHEIIKEVIKEEAKEEWFKETIRDVLDDDILRDKIKEIVKEFLEHYMDGQDDEDFKWLEEYLKELFGKLVGEDWFYDIICSIDCRANPPLFDVIPTDITFPATGGESSIEIIVNEDAEWKLTV